MGKVLLEVSDDGDMAYLYLPKHPGKGSVGVVKKVVPIHTIVENYQGPEIVLDFDKNGVMIGVELFLDD